MKIADAHCDTLTMFPNNPFNSLDGHWNIDKYIEVGGSLQYFAIFTPPELSGDSALKFAVNSIGNFYRFHDNRINLLLKSEDWSENKINIILSLEGASPIINDISNLYAFHKLGVRAMGLTWNHRNFAADGVDSDYGLTTFGKELVSEMEKLRMIIDVSHLNTAGFDDILHFTSCPFIASHSNSSAIQSHKRNLSDEQIKEIINRKGFIGLNFYSLFIGNESDDLKKKLLSHIEHFLELGAQDTLGMGADFDGIDQCPYTDVSGYTELEHSLRHDLLLDEKLISKIMSENLIDFTLNNI
jgi:membrane dipeptidase